MKPALFLDFETNGRVDLEAVGARTYAEDPSTRVICLSYAVGDGPVAVWWPSEPIPDDIRDAVTAGCRVVAHNWQFDATIWHQFMVPQGWPEIPIERWSCTAFRARLARLPASLEHLAATLDPAMPQKDAAGRRFMLAISKRDLDAFPLSEEEQARLGAYCRQDSEVLRAVDQLLPEIPEQWRPVVAMDNELNRRGVPIDLGAVRRLIIVRDQENLRLVREFRQLTDGALASPRQVEKFRAKLRGLGVDLPNLRRETLETWVEAQPLRRDLAAQLITNRLESSHAADAKLDRMLASATHCGRVRDGFVLHGAHPGRWSGKGVQLQNLKRPDDVEDPEALLQLLLERADGITAGTLDPMQSPRWPLSIKESIGSVLRALFKAPPGWVFISVDLGQIESRLLCWFAGQADKIEAYRAGRDVYRIEAAALSSDSRQLGKLFVLSAGYGASGRVMMQRAPGFGVVLSEEESYEKTALWRENNASIVEFWYELLRQCMLVVEAPSEQPPVEYRGLRIWRDTEILFVQLPSGRCLKYRNPELDVSDFGQPVLTVCLPKNKKLLPTTLWHGAATENVIQAAAYDVLLAAMLQLHADGVFIIATIHDQIVALAPAEHAAAVRDHMVAVMSQSPDWAPDLPLTAEAFINERFVPPKLLPAHAPLAPSAAEMWLNCPGWLAAVSALPAEPESGFALEGTEAHRMFAWCLGHDCDPEVVTQDPQFLLPLRHALLLARDVIAGRRFKVEARVDPLPGLPLVWGTADILVFDAHDRLVDVIDLKFGARVTVEPDAEQLRIYALLAAQQYGCDPAGVDLHIIQPRRQHRDGPHRRYHLACAGMLALYEQLQRAVTASQAPDAPQLAGEWCRYCPARHSCPEGLSITLPPRPQLNPFMGGFAHAFPRLSSPLPA